MAHFSAPLLYAEARPDTLTGSKLVPYRRAALRSFLFSAGLFLCIGGAGFATFGEAVQPLVINNYAATDVGRIPLGLPRSVD